jgi:hypothetical protein
MRSALIGSEPLSPDARRALLAGCIGFAVDFFDIYLPILALASVTRYFQPPGLSSAASTTIYQHACDGDGPEKSGADLSAAFCRVPIRSASSSSRW